MSDHAKVKIHPRTHEDTTQDLQDALDIPINLSLNDREKLLLKRLIDGRMIKAIFCPMTSKPTATLRFGLIGIIRRFQHWLWRSANQT